MHRSLLASHQTPHAHCAVCDEVWLSSLNTPCLCCGKEPVLTGARPSYAVLRPASLGGVIQTRAEAALEHFFRRLHESPQLFDVVSVQDIAGEALKILKG